MNRRAAEADFAAELAAKDQKRLEAAFLQGFEAGFRMGYRAGHSGGWAAALRAAEDALRKVLSVKEREPSEVAISTNLSLLTLNAKVVLREPGAPQDAPGDAP